MTQITPFPVDPAVMAAIRPMAAKDIEQVSIQHHTSMDHSLWGKLGLPFLRALYRELLDDPRFSAYVYEEDGVIKGFIAGSSDIKLMFASVMRKGFKRLLLPCLLGILRNPSVVLHLLATPLYFRRTDLEQEARAESLFCSFQAELRGRRISGHINKVLFDELHRRGCRFVKITTEESNLASRRQLEHWGFKIQRKFHFYGRTRLIWLMDMDSNPRLDPLPGSLS